MPKVSICIPTYEQVEYLKRTLDSIQIQDFTDYEIIITDDSRTDLVENLVKKYNFEGELKYFRNKNRLGSPENWNESIRKASGEFIKIMHHDDWFSKSSSLREFVILLNQNPKSDLAFSASHVVIADDKKWIHSITDEQLIKLKREPNTLFMANLVGSPSATIFRKHNYFFDPLLRWLVDLDFYIRLLQENRRIVYSKQPLVVTFAAEGRVTDYCVGNKEIEIFEYFYVIQNITKQFHFIQLIKYKKNILFLISICDRYSIKNINEVRLCGYSGDINYLIKIYFFCKNKHPFLEMIFMKLLKSK